MACLKIESACSTVNEYADQMPNLPINVIYCYWSQNDDCVTFNIFKPLCVVRDMSITTID